MQILVTSWGVPLPGSLSPDSILQLLRWPLLPSVLLCPQRFVGDPALGNDEGGLTVRAEVGWAGPQSWILAKQLHMTPGSQGLIISYGRGVVTLP